MDIKEQQGKVIQGKEFVYIASKWDSSHKQEFMYKKIVKKNQNPKVLVWTECDAFLMHGMYSCIEIDGAKIKIERHCWFPCDNLS